ncbi:MAG: outer membrane protein [Myxococcales bacterium]|nr:outer membrane protein [Myxococcales bacterium]
MKLTPLAKLLITLVVLGAVGAGIYSQRDKLFPGKKPQTVSVPPKVDLDGSGSATASTAKITLNEKPGCADKPEVRLYHWAWNAQMGMMYATGGKQAAEGSLMCKHGVNLKLVREDSTDQMQSLLLAFAEDLKSGSKNPSKGAHFIIIMGDGGAAFFKAINDRLDKLGKEYEVEVVGSAGFSRGEDKFMGPQQWKDNPQSARGGLVAGVLRDGDWNIAMKWLGDNGIPNNPDETTFDPNALNWVNSSDYIDAAQKYVTGYCADLKNTKTGSKDKHCVQGIVTWTPGDVTAAENKGGIVSIVSTREYRSQMPAVIIGNKKWINANRDTVKGMLAAIFEGADAVKDEANLKKAAAISAAVYNEKDGDYWYKYFSPQSVKDKAGITVDLGGSAVSNLADNLLLFGLSQGAKNAFAATYTTFGNVVKSQYPDLVPSFPPVGDISDTSFVAELAKAEAPTTKPDVQKFDPTAVKQQAAVVVSRKNWNIAFDSGKASFTGQAETTLKTLLNDLVIASGTTVEIHGHTDNAGSPEGNMKLSEDRAFAVKQWLEAQAPQNFPEGRVKVFSHGQTQPVVPNSNAEGKAKNRRVEIVLGSTSSQI